MRPIIRCIFTAALAAAAVDVGAQTVGPSMGDPPAAERWTRPRPHLRLLKREVRRFDFEERTEQPYDFPRAFFRIGPADAVQGADTPGVPADATLAAARPGFPLFGEMGFSDEVARSGAWSFRFGLAGGSMAASLAPRAVPIVPGGSYLASVWVRTEGLTNAAARLAAVYYDADEQPIPASLTESEPIRTDGEWRELVVRIDGEHPRATDLVVELQLLQPAEYRGGSSPVEPVIEDVTGEVFFDDLTIWHVPQIELTTGAPGNVVMPPDRPRLTLTVSDLATDALAADLRVRDIAGRRVHAERFLIERGRSGQTIDLKDLPFGWYEATLALSADGESLGGRRLAFLYTPAAEPADRLGGWFGVSLPDLAAEHVPDAATLIRRLGIPAAVLPAWDHFHAADSHAPAADTAPGAGMRQAVERLLDDGRTVIFSLPVVPDHAARAMMLDPRQVLDLFGADPEHLRPLLEDMLIRFGQRVRQWQIGTTRAPDAFWHDDPAHVRRSATAAIGRLVPGPSVILPWSVEQAPIDGPDAEGYNLVIPTSVNPAWLEENLEPWRDRNRRFPVVTLETLPQRYGARQIALDLVMRMLHARRVGVSRLLMRDPWRRPDDDLEPRPTLAPWLILSRVLDGKRFAGEIEAGTGVRCWQFETDDESILIAWNETAPPADARLRMRLANGPVTVADWLGNERTVELANGQHSIELSDTPVIVSDINAHLVQLRRHMAIEPAFAPSIVREHEHAVLMRNPWATTITGSIRFIARTGWRFAPTRLHFSIPAGGEVRLPFVLTFGRSEIAGPTEIEAALELVADQPYDFRIAMPFEIGLEHLSLQPIWRLAANDEGELTDLIVTAYVTNTGDVAMSLEADALAPAYRRMKRTISRLEPGETVMKSFYFENAATRLVGEEILIGVAEIDSSARLNRSVPAPIFPSSRVTQEPD